MLISLADWHARWPKGWTEWPSSTSSLWFMPTFSSKPKDAEKKAWFQNDANSNFTWAQDWEVQDINLSIIMKEILDKTIEIKPWEYDRVVSKAYAAYANTHDTQDAAQTAGAVSEIVFKDLNNLVTCSWKQEAKDWSDQAIQFLSQYLVRMHMYNLWNAQAQQDGCQQNGGSKESQSSQSQGETSIFSSSASSTRMQTGSTVSLDTVTSPHKRARPSIPIDATPVRPTQSYNGHHKQPFDKRQWNALQTVICVHIPSTLR